MDLGGLGLDKNLGNLVIIDEGFQWDQSDHGAEVTLPGGAETIKIGYNNSDNAKKFNFASERKPVLCVEPGEKKADLENIPAIRRAH
jgi:cell division protein FtsZ